MDVIVIGAGIAGLAAAYELAERGVRFAVLEASGRAGGLILTEHLNGFTIEAGAESMLAQKPAAVQLCEELGLGPRVITTTSPRTVYVLKRGRLYALPAQSVLGIPTTWRGLARYDLLSWPARVRLGLEAVTPARQAGPSDESVASFFRRRFGRASVDLIAEPLLGGIHAGRVEALSMRSVFPRFVEAEARHGSVLRALRRTHALGGGGMFRSLSSGMSELVHALERRLPADSLRLDTPVSSLSRADGGWMVSSASGTWFASAVILAVPASVAASLVASIDPALSVLCGEVPYVSTASVALAYRRASIAHPLAGSGFVVARGHNDLRITACTWVSSKWDGRAPADTALLRVFLGGAEDPEACTMSDRALAELAASDVSGVLGITGAPLLSHVHRWVDAGAQHNVGHIARMAQMDARLEQLPGLMLAGSGFRAIGIPDCIVDGRAAAALAAGYVKMKAEGS